MTIGYSVGDGFNNFLLIDATDRRKVSGDQKRFFIALSLYPFHFSRTLPLNNTDKLFNKLVYSLYRYTTFLPHVPLIS